MPAVELSGRVEQVLPGGDAAVRHGGRVYLLPGGLPGEIVRFQPQSRRRGAWRGRLLKVVEASAKRIAPVCRHAESCGGCAMQHIRTDYQLTIKSAWVREAFAAFLSEDVEWQPLHHGADLGGRRRVRWWREDGRLGLRARASHRVVRIDHCPLVVPELDALRRGLAGQLPDAVRSVQMTALHDGVHVVLEGDAMPEAPMLPETGKRVQLWWRNAGKTVALTAPVSALHDRLPFADAHLDLCVGPDDFVQGHAERNMELVSQVQEWAAEAHFVVDLFAGYGNLSLPLAARGCRVAGAEGNAASVAAANANARRLGLNAHYATLDLYAAANLGAFAGADVLILDPPRGGAKRICQAMGRLLPRRIVMISCDPAAGARDAALLRAQGYRLRALKALDMFPYSGHVEAASLWSR